MKFCVFALLFAITYAADSAIDAESLEKLRANLPDNLKPLLEKISSLSNSNLEEVQKYLSAASYELKAASENAGKGNAGSREEIIKNAIEKAEVISDAAQQESGKAINASRGDIEAAEKKTRKEVESIGGAIRLEGEDAIKTSEDVVNKARDGAEDIADAAQQGGDEALKAAQSEVESAGNILKTTDEKEKSMSDGDTSKKSEAKQSNAAAANTTLTTGKKANETATSKTPIITPSTVNATKVSPLELSLVWQSDCKTTQTPSVKITIDADSIKAGAAISSNPNAGFKIQATANGPSTTLQDSQADDAVAKTNYTTLVYTPEKDVKKGNFKLNFLYLAQKVEQNQEITASIDVEVACGKSVTKFTQAEKKPVMLKVSSATTSTIALTAILLLSLLTSL